MRPKQVLAALKELNDVASYDEHGRAAEVVLDCTERMSTRSVDLDAEFPLDISEHAAVTLANELEAALLLCDEFNRLGTIHVRWPIRDSLRSRRCCPCSFVPGT